MTHKGEGDFIQEMSWIEPLWFTSFPDDNPSLSSCLKESTYELMFNTNDNADIWFSVQHLSQLSSRPSSHRYITSFPDQVLYLSQVTRATPWKRRQQGACSYFHFSMNILASNLLPLDRRPQQCYEPRTAHETSERNGWWKQPPRRTLGLKLWAVIWLGALLDDA